MINFIKSAAFSSARRKFFQIAGVGSQATPKQNHAVNREKNRRGSAINAPLPAFEYFTVMAGLRSWLSQIRFLAVSAATAVVLTGCANESDVLDRVEVPHKSAFTGPFPQNFSIHGIDVSKYQGNVDWRAVRHGGVQFAWIKATEGADHLDPKFRENWQESKAAGVPRGAYHFVYWCRPWKQEIAWFEQNVPVDADALPPVLDVEATPDSRTCKRTLYREDVIPELRNMLTELERHYGKRPVIYSSVDFYQAILQPDELSEYPIWIRSTKYSPHVKYGNRAWHFWQYQSDGSIPGIVGKVDRNAFFGDQKQWTAWLYGGREHRENLPPANAVATAGEPPLQTTQLMPMSLNDGAHY